MSLGISYMGTKRQLASRVADLVADCKNGIFLDLFSGMGAVGAAVAPARQVWSNDLQIFASEVAHACFCSQDSPLSSHDAAELCTEPFAENQQACLQRFYIRVRNESLALACNDISALASDFEGALSQEHASSGGRKRKHHYLLTKYFGGTYFGVLQAIHADSIRAALDVRLADHTLTADQHRWLLLALCVALSKCSTATGHFAQPLAPKPSNIRKFVSQRRRSLWREWIVAVDELTPVGAAAWRARNRAFRGDAVSLLRNLAEGVARRRPSVIYADPPYTKDQYSRYYHLYETVILYDYPGTMGRGQYRGDREVSAFSLAKSAGAAFSTMIEQCSVMKCDLVISYPTHGLLPESQKQIPDMLQRHYRRKVESIVIPHFHSTFGSAHGKTRSRVAEVLYRVRRNA